MMERTTDLTKLKDGHPYTWGEVIAIHEIAEYSIVESSDWERDGVRVLTGTPGPDSKYHPYLNNKSLGHSYHSLDAAIIGAIAYKYDGQNSQAAGYFFKMIDMS